MLRFPRFVPCLAALLLVGACFSKDDSAEPPEGDADTDADADTDTDTDTDTAPPEFPDDPTPFQITVSGAYTGTLSFDEPDCYQPVGSTQLRVFWRDGGGSHVFFLLAQVMTGFEGPGTYDATNANPEGRLQEEAGGTGYYFYTDASKGDSATITVDWVGEDVIWGEFTIDGLHDTSGGSVTLEPSTIPLWCPTVN